MQRSLSSGLNEGLRIKDPSQLEPLREGDSGDDDDDDDEEIDDNKSDEDVVVKAAHEAAQFSPRKACAEEVMSFSRQKNNNAQNGNHVEADASQPNDNGVLDNTGATKPVSSPRLSSQNAGVSSWSDAAKAGKTSEANATATAPASAGSDTKPLGAASSPSTLAGATGNNLASNAGQDNAAKDDPMETNDVENGTSSEKKRASSVSSARDAGAASGNANAAATAASAGTVGTVVPKEETKSVLDEACIELRKHVLEGDLEKVREILAGMGDADMRNTIVNSNKDGFSTLMVAVSCEKGKLDRDLVLELLRAGAQVSPCDRVGNTALHWAALNGQLTVLDDVGGKDGSLLGLANNDGDTPLHLASRAGHAEVVKQLIQRIYEAEGRGAEMEATLKAEAMEEGEGAAVKKEAKALTISAPTGQKLPDALQKRKEAALELIPEQPVSEAVPPPALVVRNIEGETPFDAAGRDVSGRLNHDVRHKIQLEFWNSTKYFRTLVLHHPDCFDHVPVGDDDRDVWEAPERIAAILEELSGSESFSSVLISSKFAQAKRDMVTKVHTDKYVNMVYALSDELQGKDPVAFTPRVQTGVKQTKSKEIKRAEHSDTSFSAGSLSAALRASGAVCHAIDRVVGGKHRNAFCLVRPPGHHAGLEGLLDSASSCGFCIFNNVMVGAMHALEAYPDTIRRIAIVDFDVHHGNGTEEIVSKLNKEAIAAQRKRGESASPPILFCSSHMFDGARPSGSYEFYPGSGQHSDALSNIINAPMMPLWRRRGSRGARPGAQAAQAEPEDPLAPKRGRRNWAQRFYFDHFGRTEFRRIVKERIVPPVRAFQPDLILVSAGFDAGRRDVGNGRFMGHFCSGFDLQQQDFMWIAGQLSKVANICCKGRVVSVLEGGYGRIDKSIDARMMRVDRTSLARNVVAHLAGLVNPLAKMDPDPEESDSEDDAAKEHEEKQLQRRGRNRKKPKRFENEVAPAKRRKRRGQDAEESDDEESDSKRRRGAQNQSQPAGAGAGAGAGASAVSASSGSVGPAGPPAAQSNPAEASAEKREMALAFLRKVKIRFAHDDSVYRDFLVIMGHFKSRTLQVPEVIREVRRIFNGDPELMREFNDFLPPGYNAANPS
ncbi:Ankyrin repeat domain-containing protein 1 [Hondaea fermentalgiana]|uniref:histone deacetylase n=1 Tax=Hondaea fermentalgiana TaxID=2315210 RepID=A0A2R5G8Q1_9STRA|nr:Ankyrin repeat domain-containing protein 1 [Hondaea fermentalgiana]|eukprot:GBG27432.1 Ankyrin repeat domain-containing protein 1 [Hondaea fermentalgiana]